MKKIGAYGAYKTVNDRIKSVADPLQAGENLALDFLHEKSHELSRFAKPIDTPKEDLLGDNIAEPVVSNSEDEVRRRIAQLMETYAGNQPDKFHKNESVDRQGRRVVRPKLKEPRVI